MRKKFLSIPTIETQQKALNNRKGFFKVKKVVNFSLKISETDVPLEVEVDSCIHA